MPENFKQVAEKLNSASSILIVLSPMPSPDVVAAGLALSAYLKRLEKDAMAVSADGSLNQRVSFLPGYDQVLREINISKSFVIDVSVKRAPLAELSYKKEGDRLSVFLKPKSGQFSPEDVSFRTSKYPYDAVVTVGVNSLEALGNFYSKYAELFFETPIINIDFRGTNENFGQFNLVQLNATSNSEIVFDLISEMEKELVDQGVATSLLAGIIAETNSFQHSRTTPQSFLKASQLVSMGANQQDIVNQMYKNKSLGFLKLWGRVLARLKHEPESMIVHSAVAKSDIEKSDATGEDVSSVLKEMTQQLGFAKIHFFFREIDQQMTEVFCSAPASLNLPSVFAQYQPESTQTQSLRFKVPSPLAETEERILSDAKKEALKLS